MNQVSIIGAGSWGTALAQSIANKGFGVKIWARDNALANEINTAHENKRHLSGISLSPHINATSDLKTALDSDILLMVTPAQSMRQVLSDMKPYIGSDHVLILCSKGVELNSNLMMSDVAAQILPRTPVAILSGPNFAHEIAAGKPAATTLACKENKIAQTLQIAVASPNFRPYITDDIIGVQIAGALKNVSAIACGIAHGMDMGESARASLVTRGLAEIARLGVAMGARQETFLGLSGVGDMMLTCSSTSSRNFSLGVALGRGQTLAEILKKRSGVTEGVHTTAAAIELANKHNIEMPLTLAVHKCLNKGLCLDEVMQEMLNRPLGLEF